MLSYLSGLEKSRIALWCYLIWYLVTAWFYFDAAPSLWLNSLGISAVVGTALLLSVGGGKNDDREFWPTVRLFLIPFCVSSFAALTKDQGFLLVFPSSMEVLAWAVGLCLAFILLVQVAARLRPGS